MAKATVVAETSVGEPLRATPGGGAVWIIAGVDQKTVLHIQDPVRGATRAEITIPAEAGSNALVNVYWQEPLAEVRVVTVLAETSHAAMTGYPTVSPPYPTGRSGRDMTCPGDSLFGQPPHDPNASWSAANSDADVGYTVYENFSNINGDVCGVRFWGLNAYNDGSGWTACTEDPLGFDIKFYADAGGQPGAELGTYNVSLSGVDTGNLYNGVFPLYEYNATLDPCIPLTSGWISIQANATPGCWFLWMSGTGGNGHAYQGDGVSLSDYYYDLALCLSGQYIPTYGACCDDSTGTCTENVEMQDCLAPMRFLPNGTCADLDPPCGDVVTCQHSIVLTDDYGDGWNGGSVDVLVNGGLVLDNLTLTDGFGPVTFYFQAATGDLISTAYVPGGWPYENEYHIYDFNGVEVCADGVGGNEPTGCSGTGNCGGDPCDGNRPPNDECIDATPIAPPYPQTVSGTNECALIDCPGVLDWHSTWWEIEVPYALNNLSVSFCGNGFEVNNVGVAIYYDCNDCAAYEVYDDIDWYGCSDGVTAPNITWRDIPGPGTVYFPVMLNEDSQSAYIFTADVEEVLPAVNDLCVDAIPVAVPSLTPGTTVGSTIDDGFPDCGTSITSPGVWYTVMGTGTTMTASLCNGATTFDSKLSVYCPDCAAPVCVVGVDDFCGLQSEVSWPSQYGATYLILVHSYGGAVGTFELEVYDDGVPATADVACLPEGACCLPDSTCVVVTEGECAALGGSYQGDDTTCDSLGACCMPDGTCSVTSPTCCESAGGTFLGAGTNCGTGTVVVLDEGFDTGIPIEWTVTDEDGSGLMWTDIAGSGESGNYTGGDGDAATASSDGFGSASYDTWLISPMMDLSGAVGAMLDFDANFQNYAGYDFFEVYVSYDAGGTWTNLLSWNEDHGSFRNTPGEHVTLGLGTVTATTQIAFRFYDPEVHFNWYAQVDEVLVTAEVVGMSPCGLHLDIKPGSCPNSFNPGSHGVLPVALLGTDTLDVTMVDLSTLMLSRWDGVGGSVAPHEGPPGPHSTYEDVGTPFHGDGCDCHELGPDGYVDLSMKFKTDNVVAALELSDLPGGSLVPLMLTGTLLDGTPFVTSDDCLRLVPPGSGSSKVTVGASLPGLWLDVAPLDSTLDGGGFANPSFERDYWLGTDVTLVAPAAQGGPITFIKWVIDGVEQPPGQSVINLTLTEGAHTARAVYAKTGEFLIR